MKINCFKKIIWYIGINLTKHGFELHDFFQGPKTAYRGLAIYNTPCFLYSTIYQEINFAICYVSSYKQIACALNIKIYQTVHKGSSSICWVLVRDLAIDMHFFGRAHNSSPHKWYCHFWDWHNLYLTLHCKCFICCFYSHMSANQIHKQH